MRRCRHDEQRPGLRPHAGLHPLRAVPELLPHLPALGSRGRESPRPHPPDASAGRGTAGGRRELRRRPRVVPGVPQLRDGLPRRRRVRRADGDRAGRAPGSRPPRTPPPLGGLRQGAAVPPHARPRRVGHPPEPAAGAGPAGRPPARGPRPCTGRDACIPARRAAARAACAHAGPRGVPGRVRGARGLRPARALRPRQPRHGPRARRGGRRRARVCRARLLRRAPRAQRRPRGGEGAGAGDDRALRAAGRR